MPHSKFELSTVEMSYPFKWNPASPELEAQRRELFGEGSSQHNGTVSEPMGICSGQHMPKCAEMVYNFKLRPDDVWIVTYPKCGTTWTQVRKSVIHLDFRLWLVDYY